MSKLRTIRSAPIFLRIIFHAFSDLFLIITKVVKNMTDKQHTEFGQRQT